MKSYYFLFLFLLFGSCDVISNAPNYGGTSSSNNEVQEFRTLMEKDQINKTRVNAEVLTYLLNDSDPAEKNTAAVIENRSNCNIIVRMVGKSNNQIYNLPIAANSKNQFVIQKGSYTLRSNICAAKYYSQKNILDPLSLKLSKN
ncbi:hypothetical protein IV494_13510 [Kaistella sp. G5-32]|uniref:DUF6759 domain-containing protein n=1 Tax=Kaistella gelatinilytica TaxID=2787636 RepID=A0ABS0FER2_9FLAO|nr:DUF6759 domain-containing protein [Kaistella gelatinilytica]MBF8458195.1 hypothetical protein [Kaistella gelatinilytica]